MNSRKEDLQFDEVKRRLRPGDVFRSANHDWNRNGRKESRWRGTCPFCSSDNNRVFSVETEGLQWHCFHCERGGGPLEYVAELENVGSGARGSLEGQEFFRAWEALARHAGCEGPPELEENSGRKSNDRQPRRNDRQRPKAPRKSEGVSTTANGAPSMSRDIRPPADTGRKMKRSEGELRTALKQYRAALKESEKAREYVERRGLSVETLRAYGCGYAPPGEWIDDDIKKDGRHIHRAPNGRIVTPHTTPGGRLVCLSGRAVEPCPDWKRKRHLKGHTPALFNTRAIEEGSGPLVLCEGPLDALSFIEAGWERTAALHNTDGVPWDALRGSISALVFAFDRDDTGREDATERAREAALRGGFDPYTLHDEDSYTGHGDPNDALQAGELTLDYLEGIQAESGGDGRSKNNPMHPADRDGGSSDSGRVENNLMTDGGNGVTTAGGDSENNPHGPSAEGAVAAADGSGPEAGRSPTPREGSTGDGKGQATPADLIPYWNGDDIGHLGRWLWERGGVPDGDVGAVLYADRELHKWIKEQLEAGPGGTTKQDRVRLRWVLWRLYAAHGPEEVPEWQIPVPPMRRA